MASSSNTSDIFVRIEASTAKLRSELDQATKSINSAASRMERDAARANRAISSIGSGLSSALGAAGIALSFTEVAASIIRTIAQFEKLDTRIRGMVSSEAEFAEAQRYLSETAQRLGVDLATLTSSYAGLLQAQKTGKITGEQARAILEGMANAAAATGASSEQLKLVFFGLNQVLGSATVTMEDVRQSTDPIPGLFDKVAKAAGRNGGELRKLIADGKISAEVFSKLLVRALQDYEGASAKAADGLNGSWTRVQNSWTDMVRTLETPIKNMLLPILESATAVMDFYRVYGSEGMLPMEQRSPERLKFDLQKNALNRQRAVDAGLPTDEYDKIDRQTNARIAFLTAKPVPPEKKDDKPISLDPPPGGGEDEKKKREREAKAAADRIRDVTEALTHETQQLSRNESQQEIYNNLKRAQVSANSDAGQKIIAQTLALQDERQRHEDVKKALEDENEMRQRGIEVMKASYTPLETYIAAVQEYKALLEAGAISQGTFNMAVAAAGAALDEASKNTQTVSADFEYLQQFGDQTFDRISSSITEAFAQGKIEALDWKAVTRAAIADVAAEFLKLSVINPAKNAMFGTALSTLGSVGSTLVNGYTHGFSNMNGSGGTYGGFENGPQHRAAGGPVLANQPYIVGEKNSELFVPRTSGTIIPKVPNFTAPAPVRAGDQIAVHMNISTGVASTVRSELAAMMPQIKTATKTAVAEARQRGGNFSRALGR